MTTKETGSIKSGRAIGGLLLLGLISTGVIMGAFYLHEFLWNEKLGYTFEFIGTCIKFIWGFTKEVFKSVFQIVVSLVVLTSPFLIYATIKTYNHRSDRLRGVGLTDTKSGSDKR